MATMQKATDISGMDAFAQAVETYTNHTYNTTLENHLAKEAVKLIYENTLKADQVYTRIKTCPG